MEHTMKMSEYIARIRNTKAFKEELISLQEYSPQKKIIFSVLPETPRADKYRNIVVIENQGDQPVIYTTLTMETQTVQLNSKKPGSYLFIFVEMRPQTLFVESPEDGFRLADGHKIGCTLRVRYQVKDAELFWDGGMDQLAELESSILNAEKNFFLKVNSNQLINEPAEIKQSLERHIKNTEIVLITNDLEKTILDKCQIDGVKVTEVQADVKLSESLESHLQRIHNRFYDEAGLIDRFKINQLIEGDTTYSPYKLRDIIMAIDVKLLENFYTMSWSDAMSRLSEKLAEKIEQHRSSEIIEIQKLKNIIDLAEDIRLDEMDIKDLKDKVSEKLLEIAEGGNSIPKQLSVLEYISNILPSSPTNQLSSSKSKLIENKKNNELNLKPDNKDT